MSPRALDLIKGFPWPDRYPFDALARAQACVEEGTLEAVGNRAFRLTAAGRAALDTATLPTGEG